MAEWTFLTNHGHVLVFLARVPTARFRDIAAAVGITERAAQRIVAELIAAGYVSRSRDGRRNTYELHQQQPMRHPLEREHAVAALLGALAPTGGPGAA